MKVKFEDFKIIPDLSSIRREEISDEVYFSSKYSKYVSNSRLKNINPKQGGSSEEFQNPPSFNTDSLRIGSAVHEILLQPESFQLGPKLGKPSAKLGEVIDEIWNNRNNKKESIYDSIKNACLKVGYYVNQIDKKIPFIIKSGLAYYLKLSEPRSQKVGVEYLNLCDREYDIVYNCLQSCYNNKTMMDTLHPTDAFGEPIESKCEDALFMDFIIIYKDKKCARIPFKLKIDNWTIDFDEKIVTLNDLKTSSHNVEYFMHHEYGSWVKYHYYRQFYCYLLVLWYYCQKEYGISKKSGWKTDCNVLVVQTTNDSQSKCYNISKDWLKKGKSEWEMLMKRVAAYEIFGWEKQINFY